MKIINKIYSCLYILSLTIVACDPHDVRLYMINKSSDTVVYYYQCDSILGDYPAYVSKSQIENGIKKDYEAYEVLYPDTFKIVYYPGNLDSLVCKECKDSIIRVFFFSKHIVQTLPWDTIRKHNLYLKRYDLNYKDLLRLNWKVTYPSLQ